MNDFFVQLFDVLKPLLCMLIMAGGTYVVAIIKRRTEQIESALANDILSKYADLASEAVVQAVMYVAQTFVDALKSQNAFTKERQLEAFEMAKRKVYEILGDVVIDSLKELYGDMDMWIATKIEQTCRELKY